MRSSHAEQMALNGQAHFNARSSRLQASLHNLLGVTRLSGIGRALGRLARADAVEKMRGGIALGSGQFVQVYFRPLSILAGVHSHLIPYHYSSLGTVEHHVVGRHVGHGFGPSHFQATQSLRIAQHHNAVVVNRQMGLEQAAGHGYDAVRPPQKVDAQASAVPAVVVEGPGSVELGIEKKATELVGATQFVGATVTAAPSKLPQLPNGPFPDETVSRVQGPRPSRGPVDHQTGLVALGRSQHAVGLFKRGGHGFFDHRVNAPRRAQLDDGGVVCGRRKDEGRVGSLRVEQGFVLAVHLVAARALAKAVLQHRVGVGTSHEGSALLIG